jgi:hypothetical protein
MSSSWSSFSSSLSSPSVSRIDFPIFSFLFCLSLKSQFSFIPFIFFVFFFFLLSFSELNATLFTSAGMAPTLFPILRSYNPSRQVLSFPDGSASRVSRLQSRPPWPITSAEPFKVGGEKMGAAKRKAFGKNTTTVQKQTKSKQVQHSIPQIKLDCYICRFGLPFFGLYIFLFLIPLRLPE